MDSASRLSLNASSSRTPRGPPPLSTNLRDHQYGQDGVRLDTPPPPQPSQRQDSPVDDDLSERAVPFKEEEPRQFLGVPEYPRSTRERDGPRNYNYDQRYSLDEPGEEATDDARVWKVYLDEAEGFDDDMIRGFRETIDSSLVFAALFSAVITTFVVESSGALQSENAQILTYQMAEVIQLLRANHDASKLADVARSPFAPGAATHSSLDVWTNSLFFLALTLSLGVTLACVLVKQWLQAYTALTLGTAKEQALVRHFLFAGTQKWRLRELISALPLVLHVALGLFFAGLSLFVYNRNVPISLMIGTVSSVFFILYLVSICLPAFYLECPFRIPLLEKPAQLLAWSLRVLRHWYIGSSMLLVHHSSKVGSWIRSRYFRAKQTRWNYPLPSPRHGQAGIPTPASESKRNQPRIKPQLQFQSLRQAQITTACTDILTRCGAVAWLGGVSTNPTVKMAAIQSFAALLPGPLPRNSVLSSMADIDSWNQLSLLQMRHIVRILVPLYPALWHKVSETTLRAEDLSLGVVFSRPSRINLWIRCEVLLRSLILNFGEYHDWSKVIRLRTGSFLDAIRTKSSDRLHVVLGSRFVYKLQDVDGGAIHGHSQGRPRRRHFLHPTAPWSWSESYPQDFDVSSPFQWQAEELTALHFLAKTNDVRTTNLLLNLSYPPDVDIVAGELSESPLHIACATGTMQLVHVLCDAQANPGIQDKFGRTPFNVALMNGKVEVAEYLLKRPAFRQVDPSTGMVSRVLETRELLGPDEYLQSYLYLAAKWGSRFSAETLLKEGVSPNIDFDMSPLSIACLYGWTEIVQLLIEHHADVSASITTYSPLILACEAGNPNMVRLLLDAGADTDVQDVDGAGQMPQRRDTSDTRHANGSLENEASLETDIRIFGSPQSTTRTRVFSSEDFESMHGVEDINAAMVSFNPAQNSPIPPTPHPRPHGQTPLHIASYFGFTEIVQLLLEKGADANIRDRSDNRPLDVARQFERGDIVTILELHDILPMR